MKNVLRVCVVCLILCLGLTGVAGADFVASTTEFPIQGSRYDRDITDIDVHIFSGTNIELVSMSLVCRDPVDVTPPLPLEGATIYYGVNSFFDVFTEFRIGGVEYGIDSFFDVFTELIIEDDSLPGTFATEIVSMSLSGAPLPVAGGNLLRISPNPSLSSQGGHNITDIGGGQYHIDSFFDVFTELSIDGGQSWIPINEPMRITGTPEPATICLLGLGGLALLRKRRR